MREQSRFSGRVFLHVESNDFAPLGRDDRRRGAGEAEGVVAAKFLRGADGLPDRDARLRKEPLRFCASVSTVAMVVPVDGLRHFASRAFEGNPECRIANSEFRPKIEYSTSSIRYLLFDIRNSAFAIHSPRPARPTSDIKSRTERFRKRSTMWSAAAKASRGWCMRIATARVPAAFAA